MRMTLCEINRLIGGSLGARDPDPYKYYLSRSRVEKVIIEREKRKEIQYYVGKGNNLESSLGH